MPTPCWHCLLCKKKLGKQRFAPHSRVASRGGQAAPQKQRAHGLLVAEFDAMCPTDRDVWYATEEKRAELAAYYTQ